MRKLIYIMLVVLIPLAVNGFAIREGNPNQPEIEYFQNKEYKGDKSIYTEVDLYPPYFTEVEVNKEDILRYLRVLRNEIFARHGYVFGSEDLKEFFGEMVWYEPKTGEVELNESEKQNVARIQEEEVKYKSGEGPKDEYDEYKEREYKSEKEGRPGNTEEKYVKKVIIEANWGDGPGEFGVNVYKVSPGPTDLVIDKDNLYIYDWINRRIYKYDSIGNLKKTLNGNVSEEETIVNFTVRNDTLYGVIFPGWSQIEKIAMIDANTGNKIKTLEVKLNESNSILNIEKSNGEIIITRDVEERYRLGGMSNRGETVVATTERIPKAEKFKKTDKTQGELIIGNQRFLISKVRGVTLLNARQLAEDQDGNIYVKVWSESSEKLGYQVFEEIFRYSSTGNLLASLLLPNDKVVARALEIKSNGDIFYLYATGEIIEKDWDVKFVPGKVQVIKWELQR